MTIAWINRRQIALDTGVPRVSVGQWPAQTAGSDLAA
jgi:hypothetical protein